MAGLIDKITLLGREFTLQTELIESDEVKIRTLVYDGGRLVTSRELALDPPPTTNASIEANVGKQHKLITDTLVNRAVALQAAKGDPTKRPAATPTAPKPAPKPAVAEVQRPPRITQGLNR